MPVKVILIIFLLFSPALLYAQNTAQELYTLLDDWFAVENALEKQDSELLLALTHFSNSLDRYTNSLLFSQYEKTGVLQNNKGEVLRQKTSLLLLSINQGDKETAEQTAREIREELSFLLKLDTQIASKTFSGFAYIFAIFLSFTIILIITIAFLYKALIKSRIQEQESAEFTRITMIAQEKERTHLSMELHDTVLQDMGRLLRIGEDFKSETFTKLTFQIMTRIREICRELMPPDFSRLALSDSLEQLCLDFMKQTIIKCHAKIDKEFSATIENKKLSAKNQLQIYRIVQEALTNVEKHGKASEVILTAQVKNSALLIHISDDGIGTIINSDKGLGVRGMYQRAAILGASLSFIPGAGKGLTVRLEVPF